MYLFLILGGLFHQLGLQCGLKVIVDLAKSFFYILEVNLLKKKHFQQLPCFISFFNFCKRKQK